MLRWMTLQRCLLNKIHGSWSPSSLEWCSDILSVIDLARYDRVRGLRKTRVCWPLLEQSLVWGCSPRSQALNLIYWLWKYRLFTTSCWVRFGILDKHRDDLLLLLLKNLQLRPQISYLMLVELSGCVEFVMDLRTLRWHIKRYLILCFGLLIPLDGCLRYRG